MNCICDDKSSEAQCEKAINYLRSLVQLTNSSTCPPLTLPFKMSVKGGQSRRVHVAGDVIEFECENGYYVSYYENFTCQANGHWSSPLPICVQLKEITTSTEMKYEKTGNFSDCIDYYCDFFSSVRSRHRPVNMLRTDQQFRYFASYSNSRMNMAALLQIYHIWSQPFTCYCEKSDRATTGVFKHYVLRQRMAPTSWQPLVFLAKPEPEHVTVSNGDFTILPCASANGTTTWMKDGKAIVYSDDHYGLLPDGSLLIHHAQKWHSGQYDCSLIDTRRFAKHVVSRSAVVAVEDPIEEICGRAHVSVNTHRIVYGHKTTRLAHPWLVRIWIHRNESFCGGNLINHHVVVTAAHCLKVHDSSNFTKITVELGSGRTALVSGVVVHPGYSVNQQEDIALLYLKEKVRFDRLVLPICLPTQNFLEQYYFSQNDLVEGVVTGWGLTEHGKVPVDLREASVRLMSQKKCSEAIQKVLQRNFPGISTENFFCAKGDYGEDSCNGDSGGPFEILRDGRVYLAGLVSQGLTPWCGDDGGLYTRVGKYFTRSPDGHWWLTNWAGGPSTGQYEVMLH